MHSIGPHVGNGIRCDLHRSFAQWVMNLSKPEIARAKALLSLAGKTWRDLYLSCFDGAIPLNPSTLLAE